jgi:hypothetical protein
MLPWLVLIVATVRHRTLPIPPTPPCMSEKPLHKNEQIIETLFLACVTEFVH